MLYIFVNHGEVIAVLDDEGEPHEKLLKEEKDYTVEYLPEKKPVDWLTPKPYKGEEDEVEF